MLLGTSTQATHGLRTSTKNIPSLENSMSPCQRTIESQTMATFQLIIIFAFLAFFAVKLAAETRFLLRRMGSGKWPTTIAKIEGEFVGSMGKGARAASFQYQFTVEGSLYSGRFVVPAIEERARKLLKQLDGQSIEICYNPRRPDISFLLNLYDLRFDGFAASQNPWFTNLSEIPGSVMGLFRK